MKICLETAAKLHVQNEIRNNIYDLVWSYMLDFENQQNPYEEKLNAIQIWKSIAKFICKSSNNILQKAKEMENIGIKPKDALHIACAIQSNCDYFITTDIKLLKRAVTEIVLINPINFIKEMEE